MSESTTPHRPTHEDYALLEAVLAGIEGQMDRAHKAGREWTYTELALPYVDPQSVAYLALRRAAHFMNVTSEADIRECSDELLRLAAAFHDGFAVGARFQQSKSQSVTGGSTE